MRCSCGLFFFSTSINIEFLLYMFCVLYNMKFCFLCVNAKIKLFFVFCMELLQRVFNSAFLSLKDSTIHALNTAIQMLVSLCTLSICKFHSVLLQMISLKKNLNF